METKHSPGPWTAIRAAHGPIDVFDADQRDIVTLYGGGTAGDRNANARLIAAAPELLEALKLMVHDDFPALHIGEQARRLNLADAAIEKATGEA